VGGVPVVRTVCGDVDPAEQHGTMGEGLVERLRDLGVAPAAVVLAHLDRNPDAGEHAAIAETGAWLQRLERELGDDLARTIFEDNPARAFAFVPRHEEEVA
jgi:hypothetical protein